MTLLAEARGFLLLFAALTCACAPGCSNLQALPVGQCGNYVVDSSEDCDTYPGKGTRTEPWCRPAGTIGECRYDCTDSPLQCPSGWGCGSDGICRAASGEFDESKLSSSDSFALQLGDFDGSATQGLLSAQVSSIKLRKFDDRGTPTESFTAALQVDSVARGHLTTGDQVDDILLGYRGRVLALQGSLDSAPRPIAMSARTVSSVTSAPARLIVASVAGTVRRFGAIGFSLYAWDSGAFKSCAAATGSALFDLDFDADAASLASTVFVAGEFDRASASAAACDELAASQLGSDRVWIYGLCTRDPTPICNSDAALYPPVKLASGATLVAGPLVGLVNRDALPDLVVLEDLNGVQQVAVAYGVGDGTFHSDASALPTLGGDGVFAPLFTPTNSMTMGGRERSSNNALLAAADLDGDEQLDFVFSSSLALSGSSASGDACGGSAVYACPSLPGIRWSAATVGDFNGDGRIDLVGWQTTGANAQASLDLLLNAGAGAFNRFVVGTAGPIASLPPLRGDFDGDLLADLALAVTVPGTDAPEIQLLFGSPTQPLAETSEVAGVGTLVDEGAGDLNDADAASDMFLLTQEGDVQLTTFAGDSSRVPISGLLLSNGSGRPDYDARIVRSGRFGSADHEDIAVVSTLPRGGPMSAKRAFVHLVRLDDEARPVDSDALESAASSLAVPLGQSELISSFDTAAVAVADLDGSGTDELVFIAGSSGVSLIQIFEAADGRFVQSTEFTVPFTLKTPAAPPGDLPMVLAQVADVDADGVQDVTALTDDGVIVLRGSEGTSSAAVVSHLVLPSTDSAVFTWANLDSGARLELVRASTEGLQRFAIPAWDPELTLEAKPIKSGSGAAFSALAAPAAITAGDVTGDGIDDLVIDAAGLWLFRGQPVLR